MKRLFFLSGAALLLFSFPILSPAAAAPHKAVTETPAADGRIVWSGRTEAVDGSVAFDWSGTAATVVFEGDYLAVRLSDTGRNGYNVWIDREPSEQADRVLFAGGDTTLVLVDGEVLRGLQAAREGPGAGGKAARGKAVTHRVVIQRRSEGRQGFTRFRSFLSCGALLQAQERRTRRIEVIGDSYTCGYGVESPHYKDRFKMETENCNLTYAAILGRYFDAEVRWVSHSGLGVARNNSDSNKGRYMPQKYLYTFDWCAGTDRKVEDSPWDASKWKPDIVTVLLGTNDFSTRRQPTFKDWSAQYQTLLRNIRSFYGDEVPILCITANNPEIYVYARRAIDLAGIPGVTLTAYFQGITPKRDLGAASHPNHMGQRKIAHTLIPYVASLTGWELNDSVPIR